MVQAVEEPIKKPFSFDDPFKNERFDSMSQLSNQSKHERHLKTREIKNSKDELEFATNWRRGFLDLYKHFKWLNAYALINELAMQKILKKFMKNYFENKDNIIDKNLTQLIKSKRLSHRKQLHFAIDDMLDFFSTHFTKNKQEARQVLEEYTSQTRTKDLVL